MSEINSILDVLENRLAQEERRLEEERKELKILSEKINKIDQNMAYRIGKIMDLKTAINIITEET